MDYSQIKRIAGQCGFHISLIHSSIAKSFVKVIEAHERQRIADKLGIAVESLEEEK